MNDRRKEHPPFEGMLRLLEEQHGFGFWSWIFDGDDHFWSPGCFDVLGFDKHEVTPSYGKLMRVVHPGDRPAMPRLADLLRGEPVPSQTVQIVRDDGSTRIVSMTFDSKMSPSGNPHSASGFLLDVTDREWLARSRASAIRRRRLLDSHAGVLRFTMGPGRAFDFVPDAARVLGRPLAEINDDPFSVLGPEERASVYEILSRHRANGTAFTRELTMSRPDASDAPVLLVMVPVSGERGKADIWDGLLQVRSALELPDGDLAIEPVARLMRGCDFVAARAVLGWSRQQLRDVGDVSLSTIRRVEEEDEASSWRSRQRIIEALRRGGVRFHVTVDGSVALSRAPESGPTRETP